MTCWVIIPVKPPPEAKARLSDALPLGERARLWQAMLERALAAGVGAVGKERVVIAGSADLAEGFLCLADPPGGLNEALSHARQAVAARGATRIVSLAGDLPLVTVEEVAALCNLAPREVGIAPDRHGSGTNALSLPLPEAATFAYRHGPGSFALHQSEVSRLSLDMHVLVTPGLARDVDEADDLADASTLIGWLPN